MDSEEAPAISDFLSDLEDLTASLILVRNRWRDIDAGIQVSSPSSGIKAEKEYTGQRGRPKYIIKQEQIERAKVYLD